MQTTQKRVEYVLYICAGQGAYDIHTGEITLQYRFWFCLALPSTASELADKSATLPTLVSSQFLLSTLKTPVLGHQCFIVLTKEKTKS